LEANFEYRFVLVRKLLETAIFLDAGNIWNLNKISVVNPDIGVFHRNNFVQEIALNTGIGFRFDLSIFMFRVDWGWPLRDPSLDKNQRWLLSESIQNNTVRNYILNESAIAIGIGYPF
jgi:outer membrane protein assembly factor BamA